MAPVLRSYAEKYVEGSLLPHNIGMDEKVYGQIEFLEWKDSN